MAVGIYPGTFDPVHDGHIAFCLEALRTAGLDLVVLLPERLPRQKTDVTAFSHRVAMLRLAIQGHPKLSVVEQADKQFTVQQTLPKLQRRFGDDLTLLIGSDIVPTFSYRWPGLDQLLDDMALLIALRKDDSEQKVGAILAQLGRPVRYRCIASPRLHAASTRVRQKDDHKHLDPKVRAYIQRNHLYR